MLPGFLRVTRNDQVLTRLPPVGHDVLMQYLAHTSVHVYSPASMFLEGPRVVLVRLLYSAFVFINGVNLLRADDGNAYISAGFTYLVGAVTSLPTLAWVR